MTTNDQKAKDFAEKVKKEFNIFVVNNDLDFNEITEALVDNLDNYGLGLWLQNNA